MQFQDYKKVSIHFFPRHIGSEVVTDKSLLNDLSVSADIENYSDYVSSVTI